MIKIFSLIKALWQNNDHIEEPKLTQKIKKESNMSEQVKNLQHRISHLQDRITLLEGELRRTQERVQKDFNNLFNLVQKTSKKTQKQR